MLFSKAAEAFSRFKYRHTILFFLRLSNNGYFISANNRFLYRASLLLFPNSTRKKFTFSVFGISIFLILLLKDGSWQQSLIVSIAAACIFDFFITIWKIEQNRYAIASVFSDVIGRLSEVKNSNLSNIRYQENFWLANNSHVREDKVIDREKSIKIRDLINEYASFSHEEHLNYYINCNGSNADYLYLSFINFRDELDKIILMSADEIFPLINDAAVAMKRRIESDRMLESRDMLIECFITGTYFKLVEELEFWHKVESALYNFGFESGFYRTKLIFTEEFVINSFRMDGGSYI